jgi:hypothetical protein
MRLLAVYLFGIAFALVVAVTASECVEAMLTHATQQLFSTP